MAEKEKKDGDWFENFKQSEEYQSFLKEPVAYFCAEFALANNMPTYAGGLGVLSGDYIKEAADKNFPIVGVGLFYSENYKSSPDSGEQFNLIEKTDPERLGLKLAIDKNQKRILVSLSIQDRIVYAQAWKWEKSQVEVYLLDTNINENEQNDRQITSRLYISDKETRLKQEMVLGIGGYRLLKALEMHPFVYHLNEGHSAFLALELARHEMKHREVGFAKACNFASRHILFTNHTLVAAGNEIFSKDLISAMMYKYAEDLSVPVAELVSLGIIQDSNLFSMTTLSLRLSSKVNAVSAIHAKKAAEIFNSYKTGNVTNGIYVSGWDMIGEESERDFWESHQENKRKLLSLIREKSGESWSENALLLGWARRIVPYKRPLSLLEDIKRIKELAQKEGREIKIVFAGHSSEGDEEGEKIFLELKRIINEHLKDVAVFLSDYDLELARFLTAGCDVWVNTPVVGSEACGTSGMKAALNGSLPLTTKDGWVDEIDLTGIGWVADDVDLNRKLLDIIEMHIIPTYYSHLKNTKNSLWLARMKNGRDLILEKFSMTRALREYVENFYIPISKQKHQA